MRIRFKAALLIATFALGLTESAFAESTRHDLKIEPQPLAAALQELAAQTGLQVIVMSEDAGDKQSRAIEGSFTDEEALVKLLENTGLTYQKIDDRTVAIKPVPASLPAAAVASEKTTLRLAQADSASASQQAAAEPSAGASEPLEQLEEITVTAQKRMERLQDVPISISVLSGADLDKSTVEGMTEALNRVPGVATNVNLLGGGSAVTIRGVTSSALVLAGSSAVGYYLDSMPFGLVKSAIAPDSNAYDLERVEVLRGPQGTLYGAGGEGGVVRVLTHDADLNEFEVKARTSASGTQDGSESYRGDLAVNVPLVDGKLAARAVVGYQDLGGWIDHPNRKDANDAEITNVRLKLNAQPTDALSIGLSVWRSRADYGVASFSDSNRRSGGVLDESIDNDYDVYGLKLGYDFSGVSVTSMTSYLDYKIGSALDLLPANLADVPLFTSLSSKVFSQEVNLNSTGRGLWRWTAGGIYRDGEDLFGQDWVFLAAPTRDSDLSESFAIFGELTRLMLDGRLELTAGLRYFEDDVKFREKISFTGVPGTPLERADDTFTATTPRVVLNWHPSGQLSVYASYAEGFRSGFNQNSQNLALFPGIPSVKPDSLKNYEVGAKGNTWGGRLAFDSALYFIDWQDIQQQLTTQVGNQFPVVGLNGESASGVGFDLGVTLKPVDRLTLGVNFSWNDLTMDSVVDSEDPNDPTGPRVVIFSKGSRILYSPEYTVGASADYEFPLGAGGLDGRFSLSGNYTSKELAGTGVNPLEGDSMLIARASFGIASADRWALTLFGDNLTDEDGTPTPHEFVPDWSTRIRPRTIGAQLEFRF